MFVHIVHPFPSLADSIFDYFFPPGISTSTRKPAGFCAVFGIRSEGTSLTGFVEAGWVFNRHVKFLHGTPGFNIDSGFVGSIGLRF